MPALLKTTQIQEPSSASVNIQLDSSGNVALVPTAGNIGIGTSSPVTKLDVSGIATVRNTGTAFNTTPNTNYGLNFQASSSGVTYIISYSSGGSTSIAFATNSGGGAAAERARIDESGNVNIATTGVSAKLYVNGNSASNIAALTDGATITPDFSTGNNFSVTLGGNRTLANPTNLIVGQSGVIYVSQDATGSRTLAYGSFWKFPGGTAPTLTTTASATDALFYVVRTSTSITVSSALNIG